MPKPKAPELYFKDWVEIYGPERLADDLGLHPMTVMKWTRGHFLPRVEAMQKIKKLSKGRVDYAHIIDSLPLSKE